MRELEGHSFTLIFVNILAIVERRAIYVCSTKEMESVLTRDKKGPSK